MTLINKTSHRPTRLAQKASRGMSLVEVMVGFALLAIAMAGIFGLLMQSYRLSAKTRYIDESRSVLRTLATQFMPPTNPADNPTLFAITSSPTGTGLSWDGSSGHIDGTSAGLDVQIGEDAGMPLMAHVTREVSELNETTGAVDPSSSANGSVGRLIQCRLNISFTSEGQTWAKSITMVRSTQ